VNQQVYKKLKKLKRFTRNSTNARAILAHAACHVSPDAVTFTNKLSKYGYKHNKHYYTSILNLNFKTNADFRAGIAVGTVQTNAKALWLAIRDNATSVGCESTL